jgi:hypothetical protein
MPAPSHLRSRAVRRRGDNTPGRPLQHARRPRPSGGASGNATLTRVTAALLVILLVAEGITVLNVEGLVRPHMFIGLVLIPPIVLKLGSTGYRFVRYYTGSAAYREQGPPKLLLRITAPALVLATVTLFGSGVWLLALGHSSGGVLAVHTASFAVWAAAFAIHFLGHAPTLARSLRSDWRAMLGGSIAGAGVRAMLLAAALGGGLALALALLGLITGWHGESG